MNSFSSGSICSASKKRRVEQNNEWSRAGIELQLQLELEILQDSCLLPVLALLVVVGLVTPLIQLTPPCSKVLLSWRADTG